MKTQYKLICDKCNNVVERSKQEVEHTEITVVGKSCQLCKGKKLSIWRSKV